MIVRPLVFDIEANGLLDTVSVIHCAVFRDLEGKKVKVFDPSDIHLLPEFLNQCPVLIGHNIISYDFPAIEKVLGFTYKGKKVDTLIMSRLLNPKLLLPPHALDRRAGPHSLYAWGVRLGVDKPDHEDWENYSPEMLHRCSEDVKINVKLYHRLMEESKAYNWMPAFKMSFTLFELLQKQEEYGWKVDVGYMHYLVGWLDRKIERINKVVAKHLPKVVEVHETKLDGEFRYVKKPFLKSGEYSTHVINYFGESSSEIVEKQVKGPYTRVSFRPVNLNSNDETKSFLLSLGWEPAEWNTDSEGNRTSPKLSKDDPFEGVNGALGRLCAKRVQCRQRRSIIEGLIDLVREDGAIASVVTTLADTSRAIHRNIVNIPGGKSFFGKEMRKMFVARENRVLVSTDSDSCQLRMLGGRIKSESYIHAIVTGDKDKGTDLHSLTKKIAELDSRDTAKTVIYCLLFGGGDPKLGRSAKKPGEGSDIRKKLYVGFDGLEEHMAEITKQWRSTAKKRFNAKFNRFEYYDGYIIGLDGRPIKVPFEHQLLVYELQSDEAIMMTAAYIKAFKTLEQKGLKWGEDFGFVCWYHDEFTIETKPEYAELVKQVSEDSIVWAGKHFNIYCPHKGDGKIGANWKEVH